MATIKTRLTELLGIEKPIMLAGMGGISHKEVKKFENKRDLIFFFSKACFCCQSFWRFWNSWFCCYG